MRRSSLLFALTCLTVLGMAQPGNAELNCTEPDQIAIVFDNGDINYSPSSAVPFNAYAVLLNPSQPGADGFEFKVVLPSMVGSLFRLQEILPIGAINVGNSSGSTEWEYIVGFPSPLPPSNGQITLVSWNLMTVSNPGERDWYIQPTTFPSIPGNLAYNYTLPGEQAVLTAMQPISGSFAAPIARWWPIVPLEYCTATVAPDFTLTVAGEGETIVAGAATNATDWLDAGIDLPDTTPLLAFPHPEWGGASTNYQRDIRATYDPTSAVKTWTFVASPLQSGSADYQVDLAFVSTLGAGSGVDLQLHDRTSGTTIDLRDAGMEYAYVDASPHTFDLMIGTDAAATPSLVVDISVDSGQYSDPLTRAATQANATDGFDSDFDFPEPSPPPGGYLAASFEHGGWPLGPRFSTDVRSLFDPESESRVWPLMVETDLSGSVVLTFSPSFGAADGYGLFLRDMFTGQTFDLFPSLSYVYANFGSPSTRHFELIVGASAPPALAPTSRALPAGWSMVGLPLAPAASASTVGAVLLDPSPGYAYAFIHNRLLGYQSVPPWTTAVQGKGYWLGTSAAFNWTMEGTRTLDGLNVPLASGWNLVGNANWFPGPFEGLRIIYNGTTYDWQTAVNLQLVTSDVQGYNTALSSYYNAVDLQPWQGYWIYAVQNGLTLRFQWQNFMEIPARLSTPPSQDKDVDAGWRSELVLTGAENGQRSITYGVATGATAGFDAAYDCPQPPAAPEGGMALSFQHPEWDLPGASAFTRDLVGPAEEPVHWTATLSAPAAEEALLSWNPADWPDGVDYQLYFPHENRVVVMSMRRQTSLKVAVSPQPMSVVMRTPDMTSGTDVPTGDREYTLAAQPNPFNPSTTVSFNLPTAGRAEIRIYSVRGELVGIIGGREYVAGRHQETWSGRDRAGRDVPSGAYFGRLHVDGQARGPVVRLSLVR